MSREAKGDRQLLLSYLCWKQLFNLCPNMCPKCSLPVHNARHPNQDVPQPMLLLHPWWLPNVLTLRYCQGLYHLHLLPRMVASHSSPVPHTYSQTHPVPEGPIQHDPFPTRALLQLHPRCPSHPSQQLVDLPTNSCRWMETTEPSTSAPNGKRLKVVSIFHRHVSLHCGDRKVRYGCPTTPVSLLGWRRSDPPSVQVMPCFSQVSLPCCTRQ